MIKHSAFKVQQAEPRVSGRAINLLATSREKDDGDSMTGLEIAYVEA